MYSSVLWQITERPIRRWSAIFCNRWKATKCKFSVVLLGASTTTVSTRTRKLPEVREKLSCSSTFTQFYYCIHSYIKHNCHLFLVYSERCHFFNKNEQKKIRLSRLFSILAMNNCLIILKRFVSEVLSCAKHQARFELAVWSSSMIAERDNILVKSIVAVVLCNQGVLFLEDYPIASIVSLTCRQEIPIDQMAQCFSATVAVAELPHQRLQKVNERSFYLTLAGKVTN